MDFDICLYHVTTSQIKTLNISIIPEGSLMPFPSQYHHHPTLPQGNTVMTSTTIGAFCLFLNFIYTLFIYLFI